MNVPLDLPAYQVKMGMADPSAFIGTYVEALREALGISQESFSRELGISWKTYQTWAHRTRTPQFPSVVSLLASELYLLSHGGFDPCDGLLGKLMTNYLSRDEADNLIAQLYKVRESMPEDTDGED